MTTEDDEYTEFVRARLARWRRIGYLMTGDWDRGDDVVQRTITELYQKWPRARRATNLDGLVHTMLMRRFVDEKRRGWAKVRLGGYLPDQPVPEAPDPGERMAVVAALRQLPPRQRAVLVLRYLMDLDVEATAEALGCTAGTVKSQASRGLDKLREIFAADAVPVGEGT